MTFRGAIRSVETRWHPDGCNFRIPTARVELERWLQERPSTEGGIDVLQEFEDSLKKFMDCTRFEVAEGKSGATSFLLKALDVSFSVPVYVRLSVKEIPIDGGRPLHPDILQPIFSRSITIGENPNPKLNERFTMEVLVGVECLQSVEKELDKIDAINSNLRDAGLNYWDERFPSNFCYLKDAAKKKRPQSCRSGWRSNHCLLQRCV